MTVRLKKGVYSLIRISALIVPLFVYSVSLAAEDWPQFRGADGTGLSILQKSAGSVRAGKERRVANCVTSGPFIACAGGKLHFPDGI